MPFTTFLCTSLLYPHLPVLTFLSVSFILWLSWSPVESLAHVEMMAVLTWCQSEVPIQAALKKVTSTWLSEVFSDPSPSWEDVMQVPKTPGLTPFGDRCH